MRRDVLELMAEEVGGRPVGPLASFQVFDEGGRRKLDGMAAGRRWDIDREHRALAKDTQRLYASLRWKRWYAANKDAFTRYRRAWGAANPDKEREYRRRKLVARKKDLRLAAVYKARQDRHKPKKRLRAKQRYWTDVEKSRAKQRAMAAKQYPKRPRQGKRRCSLCRRPGHNSRRCELRR